MVGGHPLSGLLQGAEYTVSTWDGWRERPDVKRDPISRERADGDFPTPWQYEARYITLGGMIFAKSHEQMHHIEEQLNGLCATQREWLTIQGHGPTASALVEPDGKPILKQITDTVLEFVLYFKANDPRKTGALYRNPISRTTTVHSQIGNYPVAPELRIKAFNAPSGFAIEAAYDGITRRWEYVTGAWSSQDHVIDMATGKHFANGVERANRLGQADLWNIPPRTEVAVRLMAIGSSDLISGELVYRDTWI